MSSNGQTTANLVLSAASQLTAAQFETFQRLCKRLLHGPQFQLIVLDCRDERLQHQLQQLLAEFSQQNSLRAATLRLDDNIPDVFALQLQLQTLVTDNTVIQLAGAAQWFSQPKRWDSFNLLRENIASRSPCRLLFWLNEESIASMIENAPDAWAWRSGVYEFGGANIISTNKPEPQFNTLSIRHPHKDKTARRIATLNDWLKSPAAEEIELAAPLWFELATLYQQQGEWDLSQDIYRQQCLPRFHQLKHERSEAMTWGQIAEIYMLKGDFEQSMRIRQQQELPIYQKLGLPLDVAITTGKLADIFYRQGDLEQALQIWQEQVIPELARLGNTHGTAVFKGRVADAYLQNGRLSEAFSLSKETLPIFIQIGDLRSTAITHGRIAEILTAQGQFDEALSIIQQKELPIYEKLGDPHSSALSEANIAQIMALKGDFTEAIDLLKHKVIPIFRRLGDRQNETYIQSRIADYLFATGDAQQALHLYQNEILPTLIQLKNQPNIEQAQQQIAAIEQSLAQAAASPRQN